MEIEGLREKLEQDACNDFRRLGSFAAALANKWLHPCPRFEKGFTSPLGDDYCVMCKHSLNAHDEFMRVTVDLDLA